MPLTTYTFHYTEAGADGSFRMNLDPRAPLPADALTQDISAFSYQAAKREFEQQHGHAAFVLRVDYPMSELEQAGYQIGQWPL